MTVCVTGLLQSRGGRLHDVRRVSCGAARSGRYGVACGGVVAMAARGPFVEEAHGDQGEIA